MDKQFFCIKVREKKEEYNRRKKMLFRKKTHLGSMIKKSYAVKSKAAAMPGSPP